MYVCMYIYTYTQGYIIYIYIYIYIYMGTCAYIFTVGKLTHIHNGVIWTTDNTNEKRHCYIMFIHTSTYLYTHTQKFTYGQKQSSNFKTCSSTISIAAYIRNIGSQSKLLLGQHPGTILDSWHEKLDSHCYWYKSEKVTSAR
jgi:hypothetical protein